MALEKKFYLVELPVMSEATRGSLCVAEIKKNVPFPIKRFYFISGVPEGASRGNHANINTEQILFCLKGSVKITASNGKNEECVVLSKPNVGLYLGKMIWRTISEFKKDTLLFVVASTIYKKNDLIADFDEYKSKTKKR